MLSARSSWYLDGLHLIVIRSVPLFKLTWLFSVSVSILFLLSLVLEVSPSFAGAILVCIMIGALGVWFGHSGDAGRCVCVASLCGCNFCFSQPASSHFRRFWVPFLHQNPRILVLHSPFEHCVDLRCLVLGLMGFSRGMGMQYQ